MEDYVQRLEVNEAPRQRQLEHQNTRLKRLDADSTLDLVQTALPFWKRRALSACLQE